MVHGHQDMSCSPPDVREAPQSPVTWVPSVFILMLSLWFPPWLLPGQERTRKRKGNGAKRGIDSCGTLVGELPFH